MAALQCDICGGKLVIGAGGIAVCDSCGMEHSKDRVQEKVQEIKGTVKIDGPVQVDSVDFVIRAGKLEKYNGVDTQIVVPDTVKEIGQFVFYDCNNLESIIIPVGTKIGYKHWGDDGEPSEDRFVVMLEDLDHQPDKAHMIMYALFQNNKWPENFKLNGIIIDELLKPWLEEKERERVESLKHYYDEREQRLQRKSGCYIATAVYGSYDAPQVLILRQYRDNHLLKTITGRAFVRTYYRISPSVAQWMKDKERVNDFVKRVLDNIIKHIRKGGA